jgi:hypothetical protein
MELILTSGRSQILHVPLSISLERRRRVTWNYMTKFCIKKKSRTELNENKKSVRRRSSNNKKRIKGRKRKRMSLWILKMTEILLA